MKRKVAKLLSLAEHLSSHFIRPLAECGEGEKQGRAQRDQS
jgi:hypothetical protein